MTYQEGCHRETFALALRPRCCNHRRGTSAARRSLRFGTGFMAQQGCDVKWSLVVPFAPAAGLWARDFAAGDPAEKRRVAPYAGDCLSDLRCSAVKIRAYQSTGFKRGC
ncbi:MAG: hypothetical protein KatS3mg109_0404 [Pirellulaceae bacterium]|nr:MAG: hypothetical protein KatS3mg109_0404 [Pirellulaceae bacterium]